jgi:hypothetical protein
MRFFDCTTTSSRDLSVCVNTGRLLLILLHSFAYEDTWQDFHDLATHRVDDISADRSPTVDNTLYSD